MGWNLTDVEWLIGTQWLQLAIAGVAIFHGLAACYKEWKATPRPVAMYAKRMATPRPLVVKPA